MQFFTTIMEIEFIAISITELNHLCWVTEISQRQVAFVAIMRPPRPNLKIKHEINYGIEFLFTRCRKINIVSSPNMLYNNT